MSIFRSLFRSKNANSSVIQWAQRHDLRLIPTRSDVDVLRLAGKIQSADLKLACGKPSKLYIGGMELRARLNVDISSELQLAVLSRGLREKIQDHVFDVTADDVHTRMATEASNEEQLLAMLREVRVESVEFRKNYCLISNHGKFAKRWFNEDLVHQFTMTNGLGDFHIPMVLFLRAGGIRLYWQIKQPSLDYVRHAYETLTIAAHRLDTTHFTRGAEDDEELLV